VVAEGAGCLAKHENLGVRGGVAIGNGAVVPAANHGATLDYNGTYRHLACGLRGRGFLQRQAHELLMLLVHHPIVAKRAKRFCREGLGRSPP